MKNPDLCEWWTAERIVAEDELWNAEERYIKYAQIVAEHMRDHSYKTIAEMGCGAGYVGEILHGEFDYIGYDGSGLMVDYASRKHKWRVPFAQRNLRDKPDPKTFDTVCSFAVLKHFDVTSWKLILANMLAYAKHSAVIQVQYLLSTATIDRPVVNQPDVHHVWINMQELTHVASEAGFVVSAVYEQRACPEYMRGGYEATMLFERWQ